MRWCSRQWRRKRRLPHMVIILAILVYGYFMIAYVQKIFVPHMHWLIFPEMKNFTRKHFWWEHSDRKLATGAIVVQSLEDIWFNQVKLYFKHVYNRFKRRSSNVNLSIWPKPSTSYDDRILIQMNYIPRDYDEKKAGFKYIYSPEERLPSGQTKFIQDQCPVKKCSSVDGVGLFNKKIDAYLFKTAPLFSKEQREILSPDVVWIYYQLESPQHSWTPPLTHRPVNWTATYRWDSTITAPYEKFVPFPNITSLNISRNYSEGKTKLAAWVASNCYTGNGRQNYVQELQKYIQVDTFGGCGSLSCAYGAACFQDIAKEYKFYLAFENSNCMYYITEKLFHNAFGHDIVPVVYGARSLDYLHASPPGSYIYAHDFKTTKDLADYLLYLDTHPKAYNRYLAWKGKGEFIDTKFWCRLCAMLHGLDETHDRRWVPNLGHWWSKDDICPAGSGWDNPPVPMNELSLGDEDMHS